MEPMIIVPKDRHKLESLMSKHACSYICLEGPYSTAFQMITAMAQEASRFRSRCASLEPYMAEQMKRKCEEIVPKILRNYDSHVSGDALTGLFSPSMLGSLDGPLYLVRPGSEEAARKILSSKPKMMYEMGHQMLDIWDKFSKMTPQEKKELDKEILNFLRLYPRIVFRMSELGV